MLLDLAHKRMDTYVYAKRFVVLVYQQLKNFPAHEQYGLSGQIRRAAISVALNFSEGASRSSFAERKRFFEISRGSLVELDTAFDLAFELGYVETNNSDLKSVSISLYKMLSALIKNA